MEWMLILTHTVDASLVPIYTARTGLNGIWKACETILDRKTGKIEARMRLPLEWITIALAPNNKYLVGKTVAEFARSQEIKKEEALLRLMILTRMKAVLLIRDIDNSISEEMIFDERALVGSNGASLSKEEYAISPERGLRTFPKYLRLAAARENLSFEEAVKKITYLPAKKFGLRGRGIIKEKGFADLVLLRNHSISTVIVNGQIAVRDGVVQNVLSGCVIHKS